MEEYLLVLLDNLCTDLKSFVLQTVSFNSNV